MEILDLINSLEELVVQARRLPVGGNLVVDRKRMLDIIDQMRLAIPADLREAAQIIEMRDQVIGEAHEQARRLARATEEERTRRLNEASILREAQERSHAMLREAEARARDVIADADATAAAHLSEAANAGRTEMEDADEYALGVLTRLDHQLSAFLDSIRASTGGLKEKR
ncbi:MAG: hypothetical protein HUU14_00465 [Dehalococcoidia bacterium]|nr:MAG: hypothetical protein EDM76_12355 [bacterium]MCE7929332.1 hypothetical protein [Chloroflexi bacterium CFX7]MCK6564620.1 hypothetical protein [Dehalococcoidia bacterium]MCL4232029.1 hypothetical protein [Dehalococcoidia bacterium]NUQ54341.1 hypothetical protein [Dehalococcoidia bacterium]